MHIGLYFGSFNPIHTGHCIIATHLVNYTALDQVWLVVSPQNPFKASHTLLNEYHRLHLAQIALQEETHIRAMDIEFHLPKPSYTAETLAHLSERYSNHTFSIIMGSDSYQNLPKWKNASYITNNYHVYVYLRPKHPLSSQHTGKITLVDAPLLEISSTSIREHIKNKKSIRFLVPDAVKTEIEQNGYYR